MSIEKPKQFLRENPKCSIIFPILKGKDSSHYRRQLEDISKQTLNDFEVIVVSQVSPNGRARNEAVKQATGKYLIFVDERCALGHSRIVSNLVQTLESHPDIGIAGTSVRISDQIVYLHRQYALIRGFETPLVKQLTYNIKVQHACLAISKENYLKVGGESNFLLTGTDNDLRERIHQAGLRMAVIPEAWVWYLSEGTFWSLLKKSFEKGMGSAYAFLFFPGLFETKGKSRLLAPFYKVCSGLFKIFIPKYFLNPLSLIFEWAVMWGYVFGWFKWITQKPFRGRPDLIP